MELLRRYRFLVALLVALALSIALLRVALMIEGPPRCRDGWQSPSIGERGACSWHGGVSDAGDGLGVLALIIGGAAGWFTFAGLAPEAAPEGGHRRRSPSCPRCHKRLRPDPASSSQLCCDCPRPREGKANAEQHSERSALQDVSGKLPEPTRSISPLSKSARNRVTIGAAKARAGTGCPVCSAPMVLRKAKRGVLKGNRFYGCSRYPTCRGTRRKR